MKPKGAPSTSSEDYLERIHELIEQKGYARAVDIAGALGISQPSVTAMVQKLAEDGYLNYEKYRGLTLTSKGQAVAATVRERHAILDRFFTLLRLPAETQVRDIEGIEHHLSPATMAALARLTAFFEAHPEILGRFDAFQARAAPRRNAPSTPRRSRAAGR